MNYLESFNKILVLADEFNFGRVDSNLYSEIKNTTDRLIENEPDSSYESIIDNFKNSTVNSIIYFMNSEDFNNSTFILKNMAIDVSDSEEEINKDELEVFDVIVKNKLIEKIMINSTKISLKAIKDAWNGRKKME